MEKHQVRTEILRGFYQDSVVLMRISAQVRRRVGIREIALFMGTPANHALLEEAGLATPEGRMAGPNDLIITVSADDESSADDAVLAVKQALIESRKTRETQARTLTRSLESALRELPDANLVSVSVPGVYVKAEAMAALRRNLHVFIFSDNVSLEDEVLLKHEAAQRNLFCMGPDQGTAYLAGTGLGFANVVSRGRVGCVAASGTGLQCVVSRLDALGEGVSQAIGVGGRDLSKPVGGIMTFAALDALARDAETEAIVLVSKPPHPDVLAQLESRLRAIAKPVVVCCVGSAYRTEGNTVWVPTLDQAADAVVALLAHRGWDWPAFTDAASVARAVETFDRSASFAATRILGLYTGGTLAYETQHLLAHLLGDEHPHRVVDLGDDRYTVGRPHPMIDPSLRSDMILEFARDPGFGILLVDVVLGKGSHENPAEPLVAAVHEARRIARGGGRSLAVLASIVGTRRDPQDLALQRQSLEAAGIAVLASNADATRCAAMLVEPQLQRKFYEAA